MLCFEGGNHGISTIMHCKMSYVDRTAAATLHLTLHVILALILSIILQLTDIGTTNPRSSFFSIAHWTGHVISHHRKGTTSEHIRLSCLHICTIQTFTIYCLTGISLQHSSPPVAYGLIKHLCLCFYLNS